MNNFDAVARYYDPLAQIVFGDSIVKAQTHFLDLIEPSSNVLILGGGTGWMLDELNRKQKRINIWYIELSIEMLSMARKRNVSSLKVHFIYGSEKNIPEDVLFDAVITNFFLDLFTQDKLKAVIDIIHPSLKQNGVWFVSDFVNGRWWHKILLWVMYRFFKLTAGISASELPQWERVMKRAGYEIYSHFFFGSFIKSSVFRKH
jgi:ubiquinone/menaquinone biosynthesis C-methylase UbiE